MRRRSPDIALQERAEGRARELLRESAGTEAHDMYAALGFLAVEGRNGARGRYGYLIYPHRPIVAYDVESGELLSEYCVKFLDGSVEEAGERLPDADDVLAKWMALRSDEVELLTVANVHPPGRQLDPAMVRRDLEAVRSWRK